MADDHAFLSARVPAEVRNRFKALAAGRGVNVQTLLREAVEAYVRAQTPPDLAGVLKTLSAHRGDLLDMGLDRLSVVGSPATSVRVASTGSGWTAGSPGPSSRSTRWTRASVAGAVPPRLSALRSPPSEVAKKT